MFALKRISLGSVLDCVAPCSEESLLSLGHLLDLTFTDCRSGSWHGWSTDLGKTGIGVHQNDCCPCKEA